MVELSTFLEKTPPDKRLEPISNDDLLVVEVSVGVQILLGIEKSILKDWWWDGSTGLPEQGDLKGGHPGIEE